VPRGSLFITFHSLRSQHPDSCQPAVLASLSYSSKLLANSNKTNLSRSDTDNNNMDVPTKTLLADIYPEDALQAQTTRWNNLLKTFKDTYGKSADFVSRSPGRVNIIGEVSNASVNILERTTRTDQSHSTLTTPSTKSSPWLSQQTFY